MIYTNGVFTYHHTYIHTYIERWISILFFSLLEEVRKGREKRGGDLVWLGELNCFIGLVYQEGKKDIVFRFIIEYNSSLGDFGP
jgi:hypothetical protein